MQPRIAYPVDDGFEVVGISRDRGYKAIKAGELKTYLEGRRRMVTHKALIDYVALREKQSQGTKAMAA